MVDHFESKVLEVEETEKHIFLKGSHNGYEQLGVEHVRSYTFDKVNESIVIIDDITAKDDEPHTYEYPLHLHPTISANQSSSNEFIIQHPEGRKVSITLDKILKPEIIRGSENPILGWYSRSFLQKEPTSVIYCSAGIKGSFQLKTEIHVLSDEK